MLRIRLFGHLQVFENDSLLPPLNPSKTASLLAYLLLRREHPVSRDQAAFILWPDVSEAEARSNLRRHLHLLRKSLPQSTSTQAWVNAAHDTMQWNRDTSHWLDIQSFEQAVKQAQTTKIETANKQQEIAFLQSAVDLYSGDLLEGMYEDWVLTERDRLRDQYVILLEQLAASQEAAGELRSAITTVKRLLAKDPLREDSHRHLMQLHYWVGDRAAALRQYEDCKRMLWEKFNVEPMAETRSLSEAIADSQIIPRKNIQSQLAASVSPIQQPDTSPQKFRRQSPKSPSAWAKQSLKQILTRSALALFALVAIFIIFRSFTTGFVAPIETITFSNSSTTQDTWLTPEFPDSLFDPAFSNTLFKDYTQAHLQYYETDLDRYIIRFNLDAMPSPTQAESATLSIHFETWTSDSGQNALQRAYPAKVTVYLISQPWQVESATFNTPWSQPGLSPEMDYAAKPLDSKILNGTGWLAFDITPAVRSWLAQPDENWGVMLKIEEAPEGVAHYWVDTTEHPDEERRPRLTLNYYK